MSPDNRPITIRAENRPRAGTPISEGPHRAPRPQKPAVLFRRSENSYWWWWRWYEHQNLRDERVEVFTSLLWDGVYEYTYVTRATMPGTFVVPPAKAEEMYSPEVFGRSQSDFVIVE